LSKRIFAGAVSAPAYEKSATGLEQEKPSIKNAQEAEHTIFLKLGKNVSIRFFILTVSVLICFA
jgi:hypothetical protein